MAGNTDEVIYRDFEERDIDDLALLLASIWSPVGEKKIQLEVGTVDLANYAKRTTFARVAELNGHVIGIVAARSGDATDEDNYWKKLSDKAYAKIEEISVEGAKTLAGYYEFEDRVHDKMHSETPQDLTYELVLFAVSEVARGKGVGSTLLKSAVDYLKGEGATSAFLYTDTTCNWQYYEKRGMDRIAEYKSTDEELKEGRPEEMYIYSCNL